MAAWALGMPLLFLGMELAFRREALVQTLALVAVALVLAGGTVGAVHGRVLAGFAPTRGRRSRPHARSPHHSA